jgi:hypothetical protein
VLCERKDLFFHKRNDSTIRRGKDEEEKEEEKRGERGQPPDRHQETSLLVLLVRNLDLGLRGWVFFLLLLF